MLKRLVAALVCSTWSAAASAGVLVFECAFPSFDGPMFFKICGDGSRARVGVQQGVGDKADAYYDSVTGSWVIVEFIDHGKIPSALTTIKRDGVAWHSRHTEGMPEPSQVIGTCDRKSIG